MLGNVDSPTGVHAAVQPTEPRAARKGGLPAVAAGGKAVTESGETLPPAPPPQAVVDVARTVERLNELMSSNRRALRFQVDSDGGRTVITVLNPHTKEVIRQIPPEEAMSAARVFETLGSLIDARA